LLWNPPWTLAFILPLAWLSYSSAYLLWTAVSFSIVIVCADKLWCQYGGTPHRRYLAWIIALTFLPTITVIGLGQIGPLLLLGITTFLLFPDRRPLLAGVSSLLIAIKPQLLYLFWVALALWAIRGRRWALLTAVPAAVAAASLLPLLIRPTIFADYIQQFYVARLLANPSPTLGTLLRSSPILSARWLQFVPSMIGLLWFLWYWNNREDWRWSAEIPLLLLVSIVTTSYGWLFDQVTLLPAVFQIMCDMEREKNGIRKWSVVLTYLLVSVGIVFCLARRATGVAYVWIAPAWLILYLMAKNLGRRLDGFQ
jgi:hypothetical protein